MGAISKLSKKFVLEEWTSIRQNGEGDWEVWTADRLGNIAFVATATTLSGALAITVASVASIPVVGPPLAIVIAIEGAPRVVDAANFIQAGAQGNVEEFLTTNQFITDYMRENPDFAKDLDDAVLTIDTAIANGINFVDGLIPEELKNAAEQILSLIATAEDEIRDAIGLKDFIDGFFADASNLLSQNGFVDDVLNLFEDAGVGLSLIGNIDPLVFDLDGDGVELVGFRESDALFDIDNDAAAEDVGWLSPDDGFLALDRNGNGTVDNINELFGNETTAGLAELSLLDSNTDGFITADDTQFADLLIWQDLKHANDNNGTLLAQALQQVAA